MNKKRLLALPVICIVVAMIGMAVMAASSSKGFFVTDADGDDITALFDGTVLSGTDLNSVSGLNHSRTRLQFLAISERTSMQLSFTMVFALLLLRVSLQRLYSMESQVIHLSSYTRQQLRLHLRQVSMLLLTSL